MRTAPGQPPPQAPAPASALEASLPANLLPWLPWALASLILALSLWRLLGLDHLLVWHDEVFTLIRVLGHTALEVNQRLFSATLLTPADLLAFQQGPPDTWAATLTALMRHPEHPPLYYLLARAFMALPLDPLTAMRAVSAGFGVLLPLAAFWLMQELFAAHQARSAWRRPALWPAPWLAALLVTVSPLHLLYAQEGRQYALWTLLVVVASAAFVRALRSGRALAWAGYALALTLALYTHLLSMLLIPLHALHGLLASPRSSGWRGPWWQAARPLVERFALAIGLALVLFSPWLVLMTLTADRVNDFTAWMQRPIALSDMLLAWRDHLTHLFIDTQPFDHQPSSQPGAPSWSALVLVPVAWVLGHYLLRAPRPAVWLLPLLALAFIGVVLGPDLLFGGSRSQHPRYALPGLLAVELMLAWSLGQALTGRSQRWRAAAGVFLAALLVAGLWSFAAIGQAESWWNKNFSAGNRSVAARINAAPAALVLASPSGVGTGELLSLAYHLDPDARIWGDPGTGVDLLLPAPFDSYFALTPSAELRAALKPLSLRPLPGHWQWFQALPAVAPDTPPSPRPDQLPTAQRPRRLRQLP